MQNTQSDPIHALFHPFQQGGFSFLITANVPYKYRNDRMGDMDVLAFVNVCVCVFIKVQ